MSVGIQVVQLIHLILYQSMLGVDVRADHDSLRTLELIKQCLHQRDPLSIAWKVKWGQVVLNSKQVILQVRVVLGKVKHQVVVLQETPCRKSNICSMIS